MKLNDYFVSPLAIDQWPPNMARRGDILWGASPINSHNLSNMWLREINWQIRNVSPLSQCLWSSNLSRGHPHVRTHNGREEGSSQMHMIACKGEGGGWFQGCTCTQKMFFLNTKSQNFSFSLQKELLHCHLLLCIEKWKPALSYKGGEQLESTYP